jgi:phospholipid/cholesterol/gamma-HCH transport system permease protein
MDGAPEFQRDHIAGRDILRCSGRWTLGRLGDIPERIDAAGPVAVIDLGAVDRIDTVGAWIIARTADRQNAEIVGASPETLNLIDAVGGDQDAMMIRNAPPSPLVRIVEQVGAATSLALRELSGLLAFFGATVSAFMALLLHPSRLRLHAIVTRFEMVGVNALGIIGLMSFLIGIVIAQQGAVQLEQFGLDVFTINLVGRITLRELGVLMTAIMVAGRSGSAFAAQLGTMKLTEEIDAMRTIGVSPMEALVVPRVIASVLMMPLLGFYAALMAIIGGGIFCWVGLDIPPLTFIQRLREIVPMTDLWIGLIKAPVFGAIIAVTGCYHGMQVQANAEEVGLRTTAAVVQGIFLVIVLDAFFAVFFTSVGWN